jgi:hypothetical protein
MTFPFPLPCHQRNGPQSHTRQRYATTKHTMKENARNRVPFRLRKMAKRNTQERRADIIKVVSTARPH